MKKVAASILSSILMLNISVPVSAEENLLQDIQEGLSGSVISLIYEKINSLFGAGNQLFAMEFPARGLNPKDFEYCCEDCYSGLSKPYAVQEKEFLLSDQLFDVSPIVQGSNGEKLSSVFSTLINNYVPKLKDAKLFVKDQKQLREWLLEKISVETENGTVQMSRMAIAKKLYSEFLENRNNWYHLKSEKYDLEKAKNDLDSYAKWLSSQGLVEQEKINNDFNDSVVRGHFHEVLTILGFLNAASPAEKLEIIKQNMRASVRRSLDNSSDVYPVQFQPSDWFKSLKPNLNPEDLTMSTHAMIAELKNKKESLKHLRGSLIECSVVEVPKETQENLAKEIRTLEKQISETELNLMKNYGNATVSAFKSVINIYKSAVNPVAKARDTISLIKQTPLGEKR